MNQILKAACVLVYLLAALQWAGLFPPGHLERLTLIALALLLIHAVELLLFYRHVRLFPGPLAISIVLTLLFGLLHWKPLADAHAKAKHNG
jgi:hypothetical protein